MKPFSRVALALILMSACGDDKKSDETPRDDAGNPTTDGGSDAGPRADAGGNGGSDSGLDLTPTACVTDAAPVVPPLRLEEVVDDVPRLIFAAQAPGSSDWYLLRQTGQIEVFSQGQRRSTPFLDVSSKITGVNEGDEYGLLGIAFAPDYQTSGLFYIAVTPSEDPGRFHDQVIEYKRSSSDPYRADTGSARLLLDLEGSPGNHNGGRLAFGPDGMLYVGTGDGGGSCNDWTPGKPQDRSNLFGKILRLDPKAAAPHAAAGNPFSGSDGSPLVWHYGLRNPYSFSHDFATGDLYIGDVGQGKAEELDVAGASEKGLNFGWPTFEGNLTSSPGVNQCPARGLAQGSHTGPLISMERSDSFYSDYVSVIAGFVYRGREPKLAGLRGALLFGDYQGQRMGWVRRCEGRTSPVAPIRKRADPNDTATPGFPASAGLSTVSAIVQDNEGEQYLVANFASLLKIVPAN